MSFKATGIKEKNNGIKTRVLNRYSQRPGLNGERGGRAPKKKTLIHHPKRGPANNTQPIHY